MIKKAEDKTDSLTASGARSVEELKRNEQVKSRYLHEELKKIAADKPEQLARVIKAWLNGEK